MFESFLFIPGNRKDFIGNIGLLKVSYVIVDFEDSISSSEISSSVDNLKLINDKSNVFIRLPFFENGGFDIRILEQIVNLGFRNFVVPKIDEIKQLYCLQDFFTKLGFSVDEFVFILLIESAKSLMSIKDIIDLGLINISGIALGSYDYCLDMNIKYDINNFSWAREYLLNIAKSYRIKAIDVVSMEITSMNDFRHELRDSIDKGFDAKLFIHPRQIEELIKIEVFTNDEVLEAYRICSLINESVNSDNNVFVLDGKVYEKPHIKRMLEIIKWSKRYGK
jgi:citrate lyase beta subunit